MKTQIRNPNLILLALVLCGWLGATARGNAQAILTVDSGANWVGYMNVFPLPADGGTTDPLAVPPLTGYQYPTSLLQAGFGTNSLTLNPCTAVWETADTIYVKGDGVTPNEYMDANMYVQNDALLATNMIFTGLCLSNNLTTAPEPYVTAYNDAQGYTPTNAYYSCTAFIKVFDSGYALLGFVRTNLVAGQAFTIATNTALIPGAAHVQYGFETFGPDQNTSYPFVSNSVVIATSGQAATVTVDPSQAWSGYMNVSDLPAAGGAYDYGSVWGTADLRAAFTTTNQLTLSPCTNVWETTNTYYVQGDGVTPNKIMDASMYVQNDQLANTNLIFVGACLSNNLTATPEPLTGINYTSVAFIKTFDGSYNLLSSVTSPALAAGQPFSISLSTGGATHVQYGFETVGPDANPATAPSLGSVVLAAAVPPSATPTLTNAAPTPTLPQSSVLSLYNSSGVYTNTPVETWLAFWSGATESPYTIPGTGRTVLKYSSLQYAGVTFYNNDPTLGAGGDNVGGTTNFAINTTGYDHFHVDLWTPDANRFGIQLVSINPTQAAQVDFLPASGVITNYGWVSLDIPLSTFEAANPSTVFTNLQQLLWVENQAGDGTSGSTFYIDNVYFYNSTTPAAPTLNAGFSAGGFQVSFPTVSGHNYTVQYKTNLTDAVWQTLGGVIAGDGSTQTVTDSPTQSQMFYRLMVQ
jgi:hypothetical protein